MNMKATPGPWGTTSGPAQVLYPIGIYAIEEWADGGGHSAFDIGAAQTPADAQLMAAAPDLLAACKRAVMQLRQRLIVAAPWEADLLETLEEAIFKAEGRS